MFNTISILATLLFFTAGTKAEIRLNDYPVQNYIKSNGNGTHSFYPVGTPTLACPNGEEWYKIAKNQADELLARKISELSNSQQRVLAHDGWFLPICTDCYMTLSDYYKNELQGTIIVFALISSDNSQLTFHLESVEPETTEKGSSIFSRLTDNVRQYLNDSVVAEIPPDCVITRQ